MKYKRIKHLGMLQNAINRMFNNSFKIKGWTIALVGIPMALANKDRDLIVMIFCVVVVLLFWFLDTFYLHIERKYKVIYGYVRRKKIENINYSMNIADIEMTSLLKFYKSWKEKLKKYLM